LGWDRYTAAVRRFSLLIALFVVPLCLVPGRGTGGLPSPLVTALSAEVSATLRNAAAPGVYVVRIDDGEAVFDFDGDTPRILASNTKLLTTAAALDAFGPGFFFETRFLSRGAVRDGVLVGDLGVVGGGDPSISGRDWAGDSYAVFRQWAAALRARGVRKVAGDLYLAHGLFEARRIHPDWPTEQLDAWYEAPVDALSFNDNCILIRVRPGAAGAAPQIETIPPVQLLRVDNRAKTVAGRSRNPVVRREGDLLIVSGKIGTANGPFDTWISVPDPTLYFGLSLVDALREEGIEVTGKALPVESLPGEVWERLAAYRSGLLAAVEVANKRSQNFYAESLVKLLGARRCGHGGWREGTTAVGEFLLSFGVPESSFRLADGSGMSRGNQLSPHQMTRLLRHMWFHPSGAEFVHSLPFGGEDNGGWKSRFAQPPYQGNVYAKTGTLADVSSLSGYARAVSGRVYAFSILLNQTRSNEEAHREQDRIVKAIVDQG
jgi:D-alanyl-D-alanine carboxypeptidase/D-alanyl-D-alanine-endopeptidase (penicillin-binding protein 4)